MAIASSSTAPPPPRLSNPPTTGDPEQSGSPDGLTLYPASLMPTLEDLPSIQPAVTVAGNDLVPILDVSDADGPVKKLRFNQILGLSPTDVTTVSGTSATISTRVTVCTSTSAVNPLTLPAASGNLREVIVLKASATSSVTIARAGSDLIVSGGSVSATSVSVATGLAARLLSDGTTWYHVSNDA